MAATATTGNAKHLATEITGNFPTWYQNPTDNLPESFTSKLLPNVTVSIEQVNSKGEVSTSQTNTNYQGIHALQALFCKLKQNKFELEFEVEKHFAHEHKQPHSYAILKATGNTLTHLAEVNFKATCGLKEPRTISAVFAKVVITKK